MFRERLDHLRVWKNPHIYLGQLLYVLEVNKEERQILQKISFGESLLGYEFTQLASRRSVELFLDSLRKGKILEFLDFSPFLSFEEICGQLETKLSFILKDRKRRRMIRDILNILVELKVLKKEESDKFALLNSNLPQNLLSAKDRQYVEKNYTAPQFFKFCLEHLFDFLKGGEPSLDFNGKNVPVWDWILGAKELSLARRILLKTMRLNDFKNPQVLDLCFGRGYSTLDLFKVYPKVRVFALDYIDDYIPEVKAKIEALSKKVSIFPVEFISSTRWKKRGSRGFGAPLPFKDNTFDAVFFPANDGFLPPEVRPKVYADIYRIIKPGGVLGAYFNSYPDEERKIIPNRWERCYVYLHNLCESIAQGFYGFYDYWETEKMFKEIGFTSEGFLTNTLCLFRTCWRMRK